MIKSEYIDYDYTDSAFPWTHFLMLGQSETGHWNADDYNLTANLQTHDEKIAANITVIKERVKGRGIGGNIAFIGTKLRMWSVGNAFDNAAPQQCLGNYRAYNHIFGSRVTGWIITAKYINY